MRNLLICGCYRSGTTFSTRTLSQHPEIFLTDELWYFHNTPNKVRHFTKKLRKAHDQFPNLSHRPVVPRHLLGDNYKKFLEDLCSTTGEISKQKYRSIALKYCVKKEIKYFGDKLPEYVIFLSGIHKVYQPKVIVCIRDPRDIFCSQMRRYEWCMPRYNGKVHTHWWAKKCVEDCITMKRSWLEFNNYWQKYKKEIKELEYYELYYDNLVNNLEQEAKNIAKFLNINEKSMLEIFIKNFKPYNHQEWKIEIPDVNSKLPKEWRNLMYKYNMETE